MILLPQTPVPEPEVLVGPEVPDREGQAQEEPRAGEVREGAVRARMQKS
ncbi:MAG: hypothetical protein RMJ98_11545 [Myxococcales bacterium]|nr:hypothetical protein [Myxococcales bacterium]